MARAVARGVKGLPLIPALLLACSLLPAHATGRERGAGACLAALTLRLTAAHAPFVNVPPPRPPAPPIPPGVIVIHVPLYPGAAAAPLPGRFLATSIGTPYLKVALVAYLLPVDVSHAIDWYGQQFARCGYAQEPGGSWAPDGLVGISFTARANPNLTMQLSFQPQSHGRSLLVYVAEAVTLSPRPAGSYLPADVVQASLTYMSYVWLKTRPPGIGLESRFVGIISAPGALHRLVAAINAPMKLVVGTPSCPPSLSPSGRLLFRLRGGRTITVSDNTACASIAVDDYPSLADPYQRVWATITALFFPSGTPTPAVTSLFSPPGTPTPTPTATQNSSVPTIPPATATPQ